MSGARQRYKMRLKLTRIARLSAERLRPSSQWTHFLSTHVKSHGLMRANLQDRALDSRTGTLCWHGLHHASKTARQLTFLALRMMPSLMVQPSMSSLLRNRMSAMVYLRITWHVRQSLGLSPLVTWKGRLGGSAFRLMLSQSFNSTCHPSPNKKPSRTSSERWTTRSS